MITPIVTIRNVDHAYTADGDIYLSNDDHNTVHISVGDLYVDMRIEFLNELSAVAKQAAEELQKLSDVF